MTLGCQWAFLAVVGGSCVFSMGACSASAGGGSPSQDAGNDKAGGQAGGKADVDAGLLVSPEILPCSGSTCVCQPGAASCSDGHAQACRSDGSAWMEFECDPQQGMRCDPDGCKGACAPSELGPSYLGCDYYPTVTLNAVWRGFPFAVAVGNASSSSVHVTVTRGADTIATKTLAPSGIEILELPWVPELKGGDVDACQTPPPPGATRVVARGAYRLRTDAPVTVYQLSPLTYLIDPSPADCPRQCPGGPLLPCKSYSNDASLLLPATALTGNYNGLAWPARKDRAGFLAITATQNDTRVRVSGKGRFVAGAGIDASGQGEVVLGAGDVLELISDTTAGTDGSTPSPDGWASDPSGTQVRASAPVQVIGGHSCANIPTPTAGYCDHLEEGLFPIETLGMDYLVTYPAAVGGDSPHLLRIAAVSEQTHVRFDPSISADAVLGPDDPPLQIATDRDVRVQADHAILVAQYMLGSSAVPSGMGDPSMSLAVPREQYRTSYRFVASSTYDSNFVNVIAPHGATVVLDGTAIQSAEFAAIGNSGYGVARHLLAATDGHVIQSTSAFGIVVYGYGQDTSYMVPGGLDLKPISPPPIK